MKKKVLIILFIVALAGYAIYCALAQYEFSQGQAAFEAKDWQTAWGHFKRVSGFYKFALPSRTSDSLVLKDQSSLLLFGKNMRNKGDYESAFDAYKSFIGLYPETATQLQMTELAGSTYAEWVAALHKNGQYEQALKMGMLLLDTYPETEAASSVKELLPAIYMDWGVSLRGKSDFAGAVEKFEIVIQTYAQTSAGDPAKKAEAETYRAWGNALAKTEDYEAAVEKYQTLLTKFSTQPAAQSVKDVLGETYLKWADQLRNSKQQELALEKYNLIIANFDGAPIATKASAALAPTMLEWTHILHQDKQFAKEVEILRKLIEDYKDTPEAQQASQKIIEAYDALGRQLMNDKSFISSMQAYTDAREFALDKEARSLMDVGYIEAVQGLAADTGKDGLQVISETFKTACAGQPAPSPAVGILNGVPGKGKVCGGNGRLSLPTIPSMPGEFKYVISVENTITNTDSCHYEDGYTLIRQLNVAIVTVYSTITGRAINNHTFYGSALDCPYSRAFYSQTEYESGGRVDDADIVSWLQTIFR